MLGRFRHQVNLKQLPDWWRRLWLVAVVWSLWQSVACIRCRIIQQAVLGSRIAGTSTSAGLKYVQKNSRAAAIVEQAEFPLKEPASLACRTLLWNGDLQTVAASAAATSSEVVFK